MRADTVGLNMVLLPLALEITGDTPVSLQLAIAVGGIIIGAAVMRALQGETQRRHGEEIKEIKEWKSQTTVQLQEHETYHRVEEARREERSASGSTARGTRPKTGPRPKVDR
jgi:hypothetical protein